MKDMKVLMQMRSNMFRVPGGDVVQCLKTKEYLEKMGIKVDVSLRLKPDLREHDLIHIFNIFVNFHENYIRYINAKNKKKPVVVSPIYWNEKEYIQKGLYGLRQKIYYFLPDGILRRMLSMIYNRSFEKEINSFYLRDWANLDFKKRQVEVLRSCDLILPNSKIEAKLIMRDFGVNDRENFFVVVPNAVDNLFQHAEPDTFVSKYGFHNYVLCVGVIEDRKNQLSLIRAMKRTGLKLVLIGGPQRIYMLKYYKKCREEADDNILFINWMKHEELASAYAAAKVHALPSWYETPGLASLEAGLAGCNVVTTDRGSTKEYFRQYAWYCDPSDVKSIQKAVVEAFTVNKSVKLRKHILKNYTWEKTAEKTLEAYERVLEK